MASRTIRLILTFASLTMAEQTSLTAAEINAKMEAFYRSGNLVHTERNGVAMMNPYHFYKTGSVQEDQALAGRLMHQIYSSPVEEHTSLSERLGKENDKAGPYMLWEAFATGHRNIYDGLQTFVASAGPAGWEDSVSMYRNSRVEEVFSAGPDEIASATDAWLAEFPGEGSQLAFEAAVKGQDSVLQHLLSKGVELHPEDDPSLQPLHAACHHGNTDTAQTILIAGVDVNITDDSGGTPLMRAAIGGKADMVEWLLARGADPHVRETRAGTYNALEYGGSYAAVVRLLLKHGVPWSPNAVAAAASGGDEEAFGMLIAEANFSIPFPLPVDDSLDEQPSLEEEQREAVLLALDHCAAIEEASPKIVRWLLRQCGKPSEGGSMALDASDSKLMTVLLRAVQTSAGDGNAGTTRLLLNSVPREAAEQLVQDQGRPDARFEGFINGLLLEAVATNSVANVRLLITEYKADVNKASGKSLMTPLFLAARQGHAEMLKVLINEFKADIHIGSGKYANGPTPLWVAIRNQNEGAARILLQAEGPFEQLHAAVEPGIKRLFLAAATQDAYRCPVSILAWFNPAWDEDDNDESFLCLEFPDGFTGKLWSRISDEDLKDWRPLQLPPETASSGWVAGLASALRSWNPWSK